MLVGESSRLIGDVAVERKRDRRVAILKSEGCPLRVEISFLIASGADRQRLNQNVGSRRVRLVEQTGVWNVSVLDESSDSGHNLLSRVNHCCVEVQTIVKLYSVAISSSFIVPFACELVCILTIKIP